MDENPYEAPQEESAESDAAPIAVVQNGLWLRAYCAVAFVMLGIFWLVLGVALSMRSRSLGLAILENWPAFVCFLAATWLIRSERRR